MDIATGLQILIPLIGVYIIYKIFSPPGPPSKKQKPPANTPHPKPPTAKPIITPLSNSPDGLHRLTLPNSAQAHVFKPNQTPRPPSRDQDIVYRRALFFAPRAAYPEFIWLELRYKKAPKAKHLSWVPVLGNMISEKHYDRGKESIPRNAQKGLSRCIYARYRDNFRSDGVSEENVGIRELAGGGVGGWRGPVLFYAMTEMDHTTGADGVDMQPEDLVHVREWLLSRTE